jgi:Holliday junction resolvase RusA-like endonuclease
MIRFHVPGEPKAQPRVKARAVGGIAHIYTPPTADGWKSAVRGLARCEYRGPPSRCAFRLKIEFVFARPRSHFGTGRNADVLKRTAREHHTQKPDLDNCEKAILDALNGVIWRDDAQIVDLHTTKRWGERDGAWIEVEEVHI